MDNHGSYRLSVSERVLSVDVKSARKNSRKTYHRLRISALMAFPPLFYFESTASDGMPINIPDAA